jgi:hypothetical protein
MQTSLVEGSENMGPIAVTDRGELERLFGEQARNVTACRAARTSGVASIWQCEHLGDEYYGADGCTSARLVVLDLQLGGLAHERRPASFWKTTVEFQLEGTPVTWRLELGRATPLDMSGDDTAEDDEGNDSDEEYDALFWGDRLQLCGSRAAVSRRRRAPIRRRSPAR